MSGKKRLPSLGELMKMQKRLSVIVQLEKDAEITRKRLALREKELNQWEDTLKSQEKVLLFEKMQTEDQHAEFNKYADEKVKKMDKKERDLMLWENDLLELSKATQASTASSTASNVI